MSTSPCHICCQLWIDVTMSGTSEITGIADTPVPVYSSSSNLPAELESSTYLEQTMQDREGEGNSPNRAVLSG